MEKKKLAVFLFILLILNTEFSYFLVPSTKAQLEDFAKKIEGYLNDAIPDNLLADECKYTIPDGFDQSLAERLWKDFSYYVSIGYTTEELRDEIRERYGSASLINETLSSGENVALNISAITIERNSDGNVIVKIPVISKSSMSYSHYNFTKKSGFYEVRTKTKVICYKIWRRKPGWYTYTVTNLENGENFTVESKIYGMSLGRVSTYEASGYIWIDGPVIAIPGHYEDVKVVVPQQKKKFRVLFPAYDPMEPPREGRWYVYTSISSTSLNVSDILEISYHVEKWLNPKPLNATLTLHAPDSFEPLNDIEQKLDEMNKAGVFKLRAIKPGNYNIMLKLTGNAYFEFGGNNITYTVQVISAPAPLLNLKIVKMDSSILKHSKLVLRLKNEGGGTARNVTIEITGESLKRVSKEIGSIKAGETIDVEFVLRLLKLRSMANIKVTYTDDDGNPYLIGLETVVFTEVYWVPEHYEEYTLTVPEHEEIKKVFVPGYEGATHIRFYALFEERALYGYGPHGLGLIPTPIPGLGVEISFDTSKEVLSKAGVKMMIKSIEPAYEYLGVFTEENALKLINTDKKTLRSEKFISDYIIEPHPLPYWRKSETIVLNLTEFMNFQNMMDELKKTDPYIDYEFKETMGGVRTRVGEANPGFITFIYYPLKVYGNGPLKSIRIRNFAGIGLNYKIDIDTLSIKTWKYIHVNGKEDAILLSASIQTSSEWINIYLTYYGKLVAYAKFLLEPETAPFWNGFWDGIGEKAPEIILTTTILVVLAIPSGGSSFLAEVKAILISQVIPIIIASAASVELMEIVETYQTYDRMGKLADMLDNFSNRAMKNGYVNFSSLCKNLGNNIRDSQRIIVENTALDLLADINIMDLFIIFGSTKTTEYEKGKALGRVTGAALSFLIYSGIYYKFFSQGPKLLSWKGKIKSYLKSIYNWITPPLLDIGIAAGKFAIDKVASSLLLSEQNEKFKEYLNLIRDDEVSLSKVVDFSDKYIKSALDVSENLGLSEKAFLSLLLIYGNVAKDLEEEKWESFIKEIQNIGRKDKEFVDEFLRWIYNAEGNELKYAIIEVTPKLIDLTANELENMGKALTKVGDSFENGFKLFNTYFDIPVHYEKSVVEAVKEVFLRYITEDGVPALSAWCSAIENGRIATRCSGERVYPRIPEDLAQAYGFEGGEPFTVIIRRGGEEYWVAGRMQKATTYVTPHEKMFENLGLMKGEYVELIPGKIEEASLFPALRSGAGRVDYHFSEKWDSVDGIWISQKGGEGIYLTSCRRTGYLDDKDVFHSEPKATSYYVRKIELGSKLEFDVEEVSKEGYTLIYEIKAWKIRYGELGDAIKPLVEKGWVLFDENMGKVKLADFQEFGDRSFEYEGRIAADERHHGGAQAVFVLNPGDKNERALAVRIVANPVTGELESRLDFSYDFKLGDWLEVTELEKGIDNDGGILFRIKHQFRVTAEETLWINTYMKWNPDSSCFKDTEVHIGTDFFKEGVKKWLQLNFGVEHVEANQIKIRVKDEMLKDYKSLFLELKDSYEKHAKGVLSSEVLNKVMDYEKIKSILNIPEDHRIVDTSGVNVVTDEEQFYFDIFTKKSKNELTSAFEVKSTYAIDEESLNLDAKLKDARKALKERFDKVSGMGIKLPEDNYYAIAIGFTYDGGVYIKWQKFTKAEVMNLGD